MMKTKITHRPPRLPRTYSEAQFAGIEQSTPARRLAQQQRLEAQQKQSALVEARVQQEARIAELEAKLAVLEPYRTFVMQMRAQMQREEQGRFGDFPPGV